jgi:tRNA threonylcarbamoyladenosine biosynthesis protein TsaE
MKYLTKSEKQTFNLGKKLAKKLKGGEILALIGELGAGKTVLIKGVAVGLGIKRIITSPSFVLMKVYPVKIRNSKFEIRNLVHIDCYRIKKPQEILDIGAIEYFSQADMVTVIEWADKIKKILPSQRIDISIKIKGENSREIMVLK